MGKDSYMFKVMGEYEKIARAQNYEYTARLAATLRDTCILHNPATLSEEQIACFSSALLLLLSRWGMLNRIQLHDCRTELLKLKLSWIP